MGYWVSWTFVLICYSCFSVLVKLGKGQTYLFVLLTVVHGKSGGGGKVKGTDALSCLQEQKKARLTSKKSGRPCQCVTWGLSVNEAHKGRVMAGSIWSMCLAELPGLSCLTFLVSPSYPWSTFVLDQTLAEKTVGSSSRETDAGVFPSRILCLGVPLVHPYHTGPQPLNQAVPCHRPSAVG